MDQTETPRIWIACRALFDAGTLHGGWVETIDADAARRTIATILQSSPDPHAKEWMICDHQHFGGLQVSEDDSIEELCRLGVCIQRYGEPFIAYAKLVGQKDATADGFDDRFLGHYACKEDYGKDVFDEAFPPESLPDGLGGCIDYTKFTREVFACDTYAVPASGGGVYVFSDVYRFHFPNLSVKETV